MNNDIIFEALQELKMLDADLKESLASDKLKTNIKSDKYITHFCQSLNDFYKIFEYKKASDIFTIYPGADGVIYFSDSFGYDGFPLQPVRRPMNAVGNAISWSFGIQFSKEILKGNEEYILDDDNSVKDSNKFKYMIKNIDNKGTLERARIKWISKIKYIKSRDRLYLMAISDYRLPIVITEKFYNKIKKAMENPKLQKSPDFSKWGFYTNDINSSPEILKEIGIYEKNHRYSKLDSEKGYPEPKAYIEEKMGYSGRYIKLALTIDKRCKNRDAKISKLEDELKNTESERSDLIEKRKFLIDKISDNNFNSQEEKHETKKEKNIAEENIKHLTHVINELNEKLEELNNENSNFVYIDSDILKTIESSASLDEGEIQFKSNFNFKLSDIDTVYIPKYFHNIDLEKFINTSGDEFSRLMTDNTDKLSKYFKKNMTQVDTDKYDNKSYANDQIAKLYDILILFKSNKINIEVCKNKAIK